MQLHKATRMQVMWIFGELFEVSSAVTAKEISCFAFSVIRQKPVMSSRRYCNRNFKKVPLTHSPQVHEVFGLQSLRNYNITHSVGLGYVLSMLQKTSGKASHWLLAYIFLKYNFKDACIIHHLLWMKKWMLLSIHLLQTQGTP